MLSLFLHSGWEHRGRGVFFLLGPAAEPAPRACADSRDRDLGRNDAEDFFRRAVEIGRGESEMEMDSEMFSEMFSETLGISGSQHSYNR